MPTYNSPFITNRNPISSHGLSGNVKVERAVVTCAAAPSTADPLNFFALPKGARVHLAILEATDMDTNGSPTIALNIGDAGSASRYFAASTVAQAGTLSTAIATSGADFITTDRTVITGVASANAATGAAGSITLTMFYSVEESATS